jgi:heme oxygenase
MTEPAVSGKDQDFIKNLRQETSESHQKLENNPLSRAILDPAVSLGDYQQYLSKMYGVVIACEDQVFPAISQFLPDLGERYKSRLIIEDLAATGLSDTEIDSIPVYAFKFSTAAEALGIMYVLEGSTLGGRILYKHIHETLGLTPDNGAGYFWGYGAQTGTLWKSFVSSFTRFASESSEGRKMIETAKSTFTAIDEWLSNN